MKVPDFPRYLKGSKLFIDIDIDYIFVGALAFFASVGVSFMLSIPIVASMFVILIGTSVPVRGYQRLMKTAAPGYLKHYIYELGLNKRNKIVKGGLPYGFDREFED